MEEMVSELLGAAGFFARSAQEQPTRRVYVRFHSSRHLIMAAPGSDATVLARSPLMLNRDAPANDSFASLSEEEDSSLCGEELSDDDDDDDDDEASSSTSSSEEPREREARDESRFSNPPIGHPVVSVELLVYHQHHDDGMRGDSYDDDPAARVLLAREAYARDAIRSGLRWSNEYCLRQNLFRFRSKLSMPWGDLWRWASDDARRRRSNAYHDAWEAGLLSVKRRHHEDWRCSTTGEGRLVYIDGELARLSPRASRAVDDLRTRLDRAYPVVVEKKPRTKPTAASLVVAPLNKRRRGRRRRNDDDPASYHEVSSSSSSTEKKKGSAVYCAEDDGDEGKESRRDDERARRDRVLFALFQAFLLAPIESTTSAGETALVDLPAQSWHGAIRDLARAQDGHPGLVYAASKILAAAPDVARTCLVPRHLPGMAHNCCDRPRVAWYSALG